MTKRLVMEQGLKDSERFNSNENEYALTYANSNSGALNLVQRSLRGCGTKDTNLAASHSLCLSGIAATFWRHFG
jgi:hypothetical protein